MKNIDMFTYHNEGRHIMLPPKLNHTNNVVRRILTI